MLFLLLSSLPVIPGEEKKGTEAPSRPQGSRTPARQHQDCDGVTTPPQQLCWDLCVRVGQGRGPVPRAS